MIAHFDLGLLTVDAGLWQREQAEARARVETIAAHAPFVREQPQLRMLWAEEFFEGFPWNQPSCPPSLKDYCLALYTMVEELRRQGRLIRLEDLPECPAGDCELDPELLADAPLEPEDPRTYWLWLVTAAMFGVPRVDGDLCVPTWDRGRIGTVRELVVRLAGGSERVPLIVDEADWRRFLERSYRPDLAGKRVMVLVGDAGRGAFDRARKELQTYGLVDCRRLPPLYEENRSKRETAERLKVVDLLVVCTNRVDHAATGHLDQELACAVRRVHDDSERAIVKTVIDCFREQEEKA